MMCKLSWCSNWGAPLPFAGYCSLEHADFHEYELQAERYREEIKKLRKQKELLINAIGDHYNIWQTSNKHLKKTQNKLLWQIIGIGAPRGGARC